MPPSFTGPNLKLQPQHRQYRNLFQGDGDNTTEPRNAAGDRLDPDTAIASPATRPRRVDNRLQYEDVAPPREPLSPLPQYQGLPREKKTGFWNRTLGVLSGFGMGAMQGGDPARAIGMAIRGGVDPDIPRRMLWEQTVLPRALEQRKLELAQREYEDAAVEDEIRRRQALSLINQRENPAYKPVSGAETATLYDPRTGRTLALTGADGQPLESASVVNTRMRGEQGMALEGVRQGNRLAVIDKNTAGRKMLQEGQQVFRDKLQDKIGGQAMARTQAGIAARGRQLALTEAGRNARHADNLSAKNAGKTPAAPRADAGNIASLLPRASTRLAERMKGLSPAQQAAEWNKYHGIF